MILLIRSAHWTKTRRLMRFRLLLLAARLILCSWSARFSYDHYDSSVDPDW